MASTQPISIFPADGKPRKRCRLCHNLLPADTDHFYSQPRAADLLASECIRCTRRTMDEARARATLARRLTHHPDLLASGTLSVPRGYRVCRRCGACLLLRPTNFRITVRAHTERIHRFAPRVRVPAAYSDLCVRCEAFLEEKA